LVLYAESLVLNRALAREPSASTAAKREVLVALIQHGNAATELKDFTTARTSYDESLALAREFARVNNPSAEAKRDLLVALIMVGNVALVTGDNNAARPRYTEALALARAANLTSPNAAGARRDLGESMERLAQVQGSGMAWAEVAAYWRAMKRDGILGPDNEKDFTEIERRTAQEAAASLPTNPTAKP
jgi:tetratricopeptide (TPR) repeat protein